MINERAHRISALPHGIGVAAVAVLFLWLSSWTGPDEPSAAVDALWTLVTSAPLALIWIGAALGYGWLARLVLARDSQDGLSVQIGLGVAALLTVDQVCGVLGLLQIGGAVGAWAIVIIGIAALLVQVGRMASEERHAHLPWHVWLAAPSIAVLLLASTSAPGVLWATEFGGYDALSYHLQLPKEWLALGWVQPVEHNVYSFLPGYVEGAYYHLMILKGDAHRAAYSCQLLHAGFTILAAILIARIAARWWNQKMGTAAAVIFLGTPWVIVVGSLAYNESAVLLMFIAAIAVITDDGMTPVKRGFAAGVLGSVACGAKLTSVGMVVAPLIVLVLTTLPPRLWFRVLSPMAIAGMLFLLPYGLRNFAYAGNPLFPFATTIFGTGHWSAEQVTIWNHGHSTDHNFTGRAAEFWNQFMRFGLGANPYLAAEPWKPQWSVLPWLGIAGLSISIGARRTHSRSMSLAAMLVVQLVFWISMTHLKSRFLIPAAVPLTLGLCNGANILMGGGRRRALEIVGACALVLWSCVPLAMFKTEVDGSPAIGVGAAGVMSGDALHERDRIELGQTTFPAAAMNYVLPKNARILSIGFATPFYVRANITYQTTWDRGPLSQLMREHPDDPIEWARRLEQQGFTHVIVNETMLRRWQDAGWSDPLLTVERVQHFLQRCATPLYHYPGGLTIYEIRIRENTP